MLKLIVILAVIVVVAISTMVAHASDPLIPTAKMVRLRTICKSYLGIADCDVKITATSGGYLVHLPLENKSYRVETLFSRVEEVQPLGRLVLTYKQRRFLLEKDVDGLIERLTRDDNSVVPPPPTPSTSPQVPNRSNKRVAPGPLPTPEGVK